MTQQIPTTAEQQQFSLRAFKGIEVGLGQADPGAAIAAKLADRYPGHLVLIQAGKFLHGYDKTAYALHILKQYKLKLVGTTKEPHLRTGFPAGNFQRRLWPLLADFGIPYVVALGTQANGHTIYHSDQPTGNAQVLDSVSDDLIAQTIIDLQQRGELNKAAAKQLLASPDTAVFKLKATAQDLDTQLLHDIIKMPRKRTFIARDIRIGREYDTVPVFEADGKTPVPKRNGRGEIVMRKVRRNGVIVEEPVQKTKKVGGGRRKRWSNKAKRRALEHLHPSGNPFLDLCMLKGRFPSRKAQFCTERLKTEMAVMFQLDLIDAGHQVISWQGVRRDESEARKNAKKMQRIGPKMWAFRPIVEWTAMNVFHYLDTQGVEPNRLYYQGMNRVGCMPCINAGKDEIREISTRFPEHLTRISEWEFKVCQCCKRGFSTFFHKVDGLAGQPNISIFSRSNIESVIQWSRTSRGGRQFNMFADFSEPTACSSAYGLCE